MSSKSTNKDAKLTVRLTPHQSFKINEISKQMEVTKSVLVRFIIDNFLNQYDNLEQ